MEQFNRHPLEFISNHSNLSMIESLIPFVDYPMKLPLALLIKFSEIQLIINLFKFPTNLSKYGLHNSYNDPISMLSSLFGISPELLKTMMAFTETMSDSFSSDILSDLSNQNTSDFSNIASMFRQNFSCENTENNAFSTSSFSNENLNFEHDDFDQNIQKILADYDLQQAEAYSQ